MFNGVQAPLVLFLIFFFLVEVRNEKRSEAQVEPGVSSRQAGTRAGLQSLGQLPASAGYCEHITLLSCGNLVRE